MRGIVHKFCKARQYNMTGNYDSTTPFGRKTNHDTRNEGTAPHFIYGHGDKDFSRYAIPLPSTANELYVFMVRHPLPWMLSRHQHHLRKHDDGRSLLQSVVEFGHEYFTFLDPVRRNLSIDYFKRCIGNEVTKVKSRVELQWESSPTGVAAEVEGLLFQRSRADVVVLVQDHYTESLSLLDHVFATTHFSTSSSYRHNTAREAQDRGVSLGTVEELAAVNRLLAVHQAVYHICLEYFLRYYHDFRVV